MNILPYTPGIIILLIMIIGGFFQRRHEKYIWNNDISRKSGLPWRQFDMSSQGCRGYTDGVYYAWISYRVDKDYKHGLAPV